MTFSDLPPRPGGVATAMSRMSSQFDFLPRLTFATRQLPGSPGPEPLSQKSGVPRQAGPSERFPLQRTAIGLDKMWDIAAHSDQDCSRVWQMPSPTFLMSQRLSLKPTLKTDTGPLTKPAPTDRQPIHAMALQVGDALIEKVGQHVRARRTCWGRSQRDQRARHTSREVAR